MRFKHSKAIESFTSVAPVKALCSERYTDWDQKFTPLGLTCRELTGDSEIEDFYDLQNVNIIMTTPVRFTSIPAPRV